jgi:hypothetical protein
MNQLHNVFHMRLLEPTHPNPFPNRIQPPPPPIKINGELKYKIAEIIDSKIDRHCRGKGLIYHMCWSGYEHTNNEFSWLPAAELANAHDAIMDFHHAHPDKPGHKVLDLAP